MIDSAARREAMRQAFRRQYGGEPTEWVRAPGRAELLGTDTDDHLGYVMTMGIHLDTWVAYRTIGSSQARVHSMNLEESTEFTIGEEPESPAASWDRYVSGVSRVLRLLGGCPGGVEAVIHTTVPIGGGLSSSASLEVACALMFQSAGRFSLSPQELAKACQRAENQCVGVACGILDQYSSVFARGGVALLLDCRSITHVEVSIPSDLRIVICDTNVPRSLAASGYARRRQECDEGTRLLRCRDPGIRTLRDLSSWRFESLKKALPDVLRKRCQFVVEENERVVEFMAAMIRDDRAAMRDLCTRSFLGERDLYEKTVPAMEHMYDAMMSAPGVVAARQSGGGFGGCMIAYVTSGDVEQFTGDVHETYRRRTGIEPIVTVTWPSDGAGILRF